MTPEEKCNLQDVIDRLKTAIMYLDMAKEIASGLCDQEINELENEISMKLAMASFELKFREGGGIIC